VKRNVVLVLLIVLVVLAVGCSKDETPLAVVEITNEYEIQDGITYLEQDSKLMGYTPIEMFNADLNSDGTYELYVNSEEGSGIIHTFVECYEPISETYSAISKRAATDYHFCIYKDELYIIATQNMLSSLLQPPCAYKAILVDSVLSLEEIDEKLSDNIINHYEKNKEE